MKQAKCNSQLVFVIEKQNFIFILIDSYRICYYFCLCENKISSAFHFFFYKNYLGDAGRPGVPGMDGIPGKPGLDGWPGEKGISIKGDQGYPGDRGQKGEFGFTGPKGERGDDGICPPERFEASYKGNTGAKGDKGNIGYPGSKGELLKYRYVLSIFIYMIL